MCQCFLHHITSLYHWAHGNDMRRGVSYHQVILEELFCCSTSWSQVQGKVSKIFFSGGPCATSKHKNQQYRFFGGGVVHFFQI